VKVLAQRVPFRFFIPMLTGNLGKLTVYASTYAWSFNPTFNQ
jgi:hypothetical protein